MSKLSKQQLWKAMHQPAPSDQGCINCKYGDSVENCHRKDENVQVSCYPQAELTPELIAQGTKDYWVWNGSNK